MAGYSRTALTIFAAAATVTFAQQPPPDPQSEGFFRESDDPALTRVPAPSEPRPASAGPAGVGEALQVQQPPREVVERELDRAYREHLQAQAAASAATPMVVSPLDGTANIASPLDGTAPIISPVGR